MKNILKLAFLTSTFFLSTITFAQEEKKQEPAKSTATEKANSPSKKSDKNDPKKATKESKDDSKNKAGTSNKMVITEQGTPTKTTQK